MNSITSAYAELFEDAQPVEVSLVELVLILSELSEDENEIFAAIDHMIEEGSVRIAPSLGAASRIPEAW